MISSYLIDIIILLIAAVIAVPLFQALKLGAVPGFLIAGICVGPYGLQLIGNISEIGNLAEIGVVFLLFVIGIELKPSRLWQMRTRVFGLGTVQVLITGVLVGATAYLFLGIPLRVTILIGPALALSSTAFVLQLLSEQKQLTSHYGRTSIAVLLLQDLAVVPLLVLVPLLAMPQLTISENIGIALAQSVLMLGVMVLLGRYLLHPLLHRVALSGNPEVFTALAVLLVLGTAIVTEEAGLSMAMGAFLAGLLISDSSYKHQVVAEIRPFRGLLLGLFFMSMGMSLNLELLVEQPVITATMVILLVTIKVAVLFPVAYLFGQTTVNSLAVALLLAQGGEFALVLFSLAQDTALITGILFQQLMLVVLISMLVAPLLARIAYGLVRSQETAKKLTAEPPESAPIVLAGFGRVGRRIGEVLSIAGEPFVALDSDPLLVERERIRGHPVFFGDVRQPELLKAAGAGNARVIIVTLNDPNASEQLVTSLRKSHPEIIIFVRCHRMSQCLTLRRLGATGAVSESIEASLELARLALLSVGHTHDGQQAILDDFRRQYRAKIDDVFGGNNNDTDGK